MDTPSARDIVASLENIWRSTNETERLKGEVEWGTDQPGSLLYGCVLSYIDMRHLVEAAAF